MTHTHCTLSHTHTRTLAFAHTHTRTLTKHSQNTHTHTHTHFLATHAHTHSLSYTRTLTLTHGTQHLLQYRRKLRPLRVQTLDEAVRTVLVDDSQPVSEITRVVCARIGQLQLVSQNTIRTPCKELCSGHIPTLPSPEFSV